MVSSACFLTDFVCSLPLSVMRSAHLCQQFSIEGSSVSGPLRAGDQNLVFLPTWPQVEGYCPGSGVLIPSSSLPTTISAGSY